MTQKAYFEMTENHGKSSLLPLDNISDGSGTRNQLKMGLRQVERDFSSFLSKFLPYLMIF